MYAFHGQGRSAGLLGDESILFFDDGARRRVAVRTTEDWAWYFAIGPLRAVFVEHVE
jgi:hypothetical protein